MSRTTRTKTEKENITKKTKFENSSEKRRNEDSSSEDVDSVLTDSEEHKSHSSSEDVDVVSTDSEEPQRTSVKSTARNDKDTKRNQKQVNANTEDKGSKKQQLPTIKSETKAQVSRTTADGKSKTKRPSILFGFIRYLLFPFSVVMVVIFAPQYIPEEIRPGFLNSCKPEDKYNYSKVFKRRIEKTRLLFPNQTARFWKILKNTGLAHLRDPHPKQPLVILLGAPPSAHAVIGCLARKLAWCLDPEFESANVIDGKKYSHIDGHRTKLILDEKLEELFTDPLVVKSAIVLQLELLPPPSPNLFYKYCDTDNSPYKNVAIIFTVHLPQETDPLLSPVKAEGSMEQYLAKVAWANYPNDDDAISALLTRIGDTVALVNGESNYVINSICHS